MIANIVVIAWLFGAGVVIGLMPKEAMERPSLLHIVLLMPLFAGTLCAVFLRKRLRSREDR